MTSGFEVHRLALGTSTAVLIGGALLVYVASRTVGLPGDSGDIGNWWQAAGVANVLADLLVLGPCAVVLVVPAGRLRLLRDNCHTIGTAT